MNDKQIVRLLFDREEKALSETAEKYGRLCYRIAFEILNNKQDAEECVSTAYVKLWNSIPPTNPRSLKGFLCRIVRNTALDTYGRLYGGYSECLDELSGVIPDSHTVESALDSRELGEALNCFIKGQNKINGNIFVSRYYFGMSVKTIADELGMRENAVEQRLSRIRKELRRFLEERGVEI